MTKWKLKFILFFTLVLLFLSLALVLAQERKLEVEYPEIGGIKPETVAVGLPQYVKYIFNFGILAVGLVLLGALIWGGVLYLTSAGNLTKLKAAKEQILAAFLGVVILLSSYIILTTINPQLAIFEIPFVKKPVTCGPQEPCPKGWECREGICVKIPCEKDEQCPEGYVCDKEEGICVFKEAWELISYEIPLGQMIDKGIWDACQITLAESILDKFKKFLEEDITVNPRKFNRTSDLNKYLQTLTDKCRCEDLTPLCTKSASGGNETGCTGDPCRKEIRDEIEKILEINRQKIDELKKYRDKIKGQHQSFSDEENKFLTYFTELEKCFERGEILPLNEYLSQVEFYEEQGWKTKVVPSYVPSRGDPLTFFCSIGGTIFDMPKRPLPALPEDFIPPEKAPEVTAIEPLHCPGYAPVGEMIDGVTDESIPANDDLDTLVGAINELIKEIKNMNEQISECNRKNCDIFCGDLPNPCYNKVCGCMPTCGTPPFPNPCWYNPFGPTPMCKIPDLQTAGICHGKNFDKPYHGLPCPRDDILKTLTKIEKYENEIFKLLKATKESLSSKPYELETAEGAADLLSGVRGTVSLCFNEKTEEPIWTLLNCGMALGNYGPDGKVIADCHPQSFFCCTAEKKAVARAKGTLPLESRKPGSYYYRLPVEPTPFGSPNLDDDGCPKGWRYGGGVKKQCKDTAEPIKSLLTCMAKKLDERGQQARGVITSFTDRRLYTDPPKCDWGAGGCCTHSHGHNTCEAQGGISCHYGGKKCNQQHKSYAVDISVKGEEDMIIVGNRVKEAARMCAKEHNVGVYALWQAEGHYTHVHISVGRFYGCQCDGISF